MNLEKEKINDNNDLFNDKLNINSINKTKYGFLSNLFFKKKINKNIDLEEIKNIEEENKYQNFSFWGLFKHSIKNTLNIYKKANRKEFWSFMCFTTLFQIISMIVFVLSFKLNSDIISQSILIAFIISTLGLLITQFALFFRRLNDINLSKFWSLLAFVPGVNLFFFILLGFKKSSYLSLDEQEKYKDIKNIDLFN